MTIPALPDRAVLAEVAQAMAHLSAGIPAGAGDSVAVRA